MDSNKLPPELGPDSDDDDDLFGTVRFPDSTVIYDSRIDEPVMEYYPPDRSVTSTILVAASHFHDAKPHSSIFHPDIRGQFPATQVSRQLWVSYDMSVNDANLFIERITDLFGPAVLENSRRQQLPSGNHLVRLWAREDQLASLNAIAFSRYDVTGGSEDEVEIVAVSPLFSSSSNADRDANDEGFVVFPVDATRPLMPVPQVQARTRILRTLGSRVRSVRRDENGGVTVNVNRGTKYDCARAIATMMLVSVWFGMVRTADALPIRLDEQSAIGNVVLDNCWSVRGLLDVISTRAPEDTCYEPGGEIVEGSWADRSYWGHVTHESCVIQPNPALSDVTRVAKQLVLLHSPGWNSTQVDVGLFTSPSHAWDHSGIGGWYEWVERLYTVLKAQGVSTVMCHTSFYPSGTMPPHYGPVANSAVQQFTYDSPGVPLGTEITVLRKVYHSGAPHPLGTTHVMSFTWADFFQASNLAGVAFYTYVAEEAIIPPPYTPSVWGVPTAHVFNTKAINGHIVTNTFPAGPFVWRMPIESSSANCEGPVRPFTAEATLGALTPVGTLVHVRVPSTDGTPGYLQINDGGQNIPMRLPVTTSYRMCDQPDGRTVLMLYGLPIMNTPHAGLCLGSACLTRYLPTTRRRRDTIGIDATVGDLLLLTDLEFTSSYVGLSQMNNLVSTFLAGVSDTFHDVAYALTEYSDELHNSDTRTDWFALLQKVDHAMTLSVAFHEKLVSRVGDYSRIEDCPVLLCPNTTSVVAACSSGNVTASVDADGWTATGVYTGPIVGNCSQPFLGVLPNVYIRANGSGIYTLTDVMNSTIQSVINSTARTEAAVVNMSISLSQSLAQSAEDIAELQDDVTVIAQQSATRDEVELHVSKLQSDTFGFLSVLTFGLPFTSLGAGFAVHLHHFVTAVLAIAVARLYARGRAEVAAYP